MRRSRRYSPTDDVPDRGAGQVTVRRARRARGRALVVPLVVSTLLLYVLGELVLRQWAVLMPLLWVAVAALASTRLGERVSAWLFRGARAPRLHERHTLAPIAQELLTHGFSTDGTALLVGRGDEIQVWAMGPHTIVTTRGLVEDVRSGSLAPRFAAGLIAHEVAVARSGLLRREAAVHLYLVPWRGFLVIPRIGWGIVAAFVPYRLMHVSVLAVGGATLWLGYDEHPIHYAGAAVLVLAYVTWWTLCSWASAREAVGDDSLAGTSLGTVYGQYLAWTSTDDHNRDRAVRLQHPAMPVVHPAEEHATAVWQ